jgi:hypothetical protein
MSSMEGSEFDDEEEEKNNGNQLIKKVSNTSKT